MSLSLKLLLCGLSAVLVAGCSSQYRTVMADDQKYVKASYDLVTNGSQDAALAQFSALMNTPGASVYFADAPGGAYGPVVSVSSISSYAFFDRPDLWYGMIEDIKIFFVDVPYVDNWQSGLMIAIREKGKTNYEVKTFLSTQGSYIEEGEYVAVLGVNGVEKVVLRTTYLDESDELLGVIKLFVSEFDSQGQEVDIGQFSTLSGGTVQ